MADEVIVMTETKRSILESRKHQTTTPEKVFSLDTLSSSAEILAQCGGQTALVFRAVICSYFLSKDDQRLTGFTLHPVCQRAINLPARQMQRALKSLDDADYIERDVQPGRKTRIRLTKRGEQSLARAR